MTDAVPLISIIVAVKDETVLLKRCLDNLLAQEAVSTEIIVIDDGSGPATEQILELYKQRGVFVIRNEKSKGQSIARNQGFATSRGDFIAIADSDDGFDPLRLKHQLDYFASHPEIDVLGSSFAVERTKKTWNIYSKPEEIFHQKLLNNPMVHSSVMFRRRLLEEGFAYDAAFDTAEDYEVFARNRNQWKFANLQQPLVYYYIRNKDRSAAEEQRSKARKIREKILLEYRGDLLDSDVQIHHKFSELSKGLSTKQIINHIAQITQNRDLKHPEILHRILYTQASLYLRKCRPKSSIWQRYRIWKASGLDYPRIAYYMLKSLLYF